MSVTFPVHDVEPLSGRKSYAIETTHEDALLGFARMDNDSYTSEAFSQGTCKVTYRQNALIGMLASAYDEHRGVVITPDDIWLTIMGSVATHVRHNAEAFRSRFVDFEGKETITIRADGFVKGGSNPWETLFPQFAEAIEKYIGKDNRELFDSSFTTTTPATSIVSQIRLMDTMSSYFEYGIATACGFPTITLAGEIEDWQNIRERMVTLGTFDEVEGFPEWSATLVPVLDKFVEAFEGNVDTEFWQGFFKEGGGSGGPYINGHILRFFLYADNPDPWLNGYAMGEDLPSGYFGGWTNGSFPRHLSKVPFNWDYHGTDYPMEFLGSIIGMEEDADGNYQTVTAWGVVNVND